MEPEQTKQEQEVAVGAKQRVWNTVTPLSKYLAMTSFIILPFVGGYVGYQFAPEKVIEVEKEVVREVEVEKVVYVEKEDEVQFVSATNTKDWVLYQNEYFSLRHPEDCRMKDYLAMDANSHLLTTYLSFIGVCDVGSDSMGGVRVTRDPVDQIIANEEQRASVSPNRTLISVKPIQISDYEAQMLTFRNETGQFEYSKVVFSKNELSFVLGGITTDKSFARWDIKAIMSTIEVI